MPPARTVVFVCLHGAAKSVIAGAYLNRLARERGLDIHATAAGIEPEPEIPLHVRDGLLRARPTPSGATCRSGPWAIHRRSALDRRGFTGVASRMWSSTSASRRDALRLGLRRY
jgi:hypothetical protein